MAYHLGFRVREDGQQDQCFPAVTALASGACTGEFGRVDAGDLVVCESPAGT